MFILDPDPGVKKHRIADPEHYVWWYTKAGDYLPKRMTAGLLLRLPLPTRDSWTGHSAGSDKQPLCNKLLSLAAAVGTTRTAAAAMGTAPLSGRRDGSVSSSTTAEFSTSAAWLS